MGFSIGHWEGDTLVVESNGYTERSWLDFDGHPHTEDLRITERYSRPDFGHMDLRVTFTDPKTFPAPLTMNLQMVLQPDTEMLEFVCENEKDRGHMNGPPAQEISLAPEALDRFRGIYAVVDDEGKKHRAEILVADRKLWMDYDAEGKQPMVPFSPTLFSLAGTWVEFTPGTGTSMEMLIRYVEGDERGARLP
jgi:hypothetical protein